MNLPKGLAPDELARLETKIAAAEARTSAQLKVAVTNRAWLGIKRKARKVFRAHRLDQTRERNCVLLLVALKDRELLVYGDDAVHRLAGQDHWNDVRDQVAAELRAGRLYDGLALGVTLLGDKLAALFPRQAEGRDELDNKVLHVA